LRKLEGAAFDTTYGERGESALSFQSIDRDLQVLAANPYLRQLISDIRPKVAPTSPTHSNSAALTEAK
jgi:hypothetical protein